VFCDIVAEPRPDHRRDLGVARDVAAEEDHPGGLARPDLLQQGRRHGQPRVGEDHSLARQLPGRQRGGGPRLRGIGAGTDQRRRRPQDQHVPDRVPPVQA